MKTPLVIVSETTLPEPFLALPLINKVMDDPLFGTTSLLQLIKKAKGRIKSRYFIKHNIRHTLTITRCHGMKRHMKRVI